ncbi:MAG TPA: hypothetical protein VN867_08225 [Candidatus Binataceae bacterium]|nr:hypothetical protein [Candidatus Binataceae bacterium]
MKNGYSLQTHVWADEGATPHQIMQDGRTIVHQRCLRCGRDFALELDGSGWHALYVGVFRVELLAESVTERWLTEECPRQFLWTQDEEARAMRRSPVQSEPAPAETTSVFERRHSLMAVPKRTLRRGDLD